MPSVTELSPRKLKQQITSKLDCNAGIEPAALQEVPDWDADSEFIAVEAIKNLLEGADIKDTAQGTRTSPLEIDKRTSPSNSFFDDALFVSDDHTVDEDMDLPGIFSILDEIDSLLMPLPDIPTSGLSHILPDEPSILSTLDLEYYKRLPPLPVDAALEGALPWAPLPPRRGGQFGDDAVAEPNAHAATSARESGAHHIGAMGNIEDGEIEECAEASQVTKPHPPSSTSLDSLIKLRLQRSASEREPPSSSAAALPPQPQPNTSKHILPDLDDPGATSKLVSAFMALRGVKKARVHIK